MIQDTFTTIAKGSCLALCLAKIVEPRALQSNLMMDVILGWRKDYIGDDGYVCKPEEYLNLIDPLHREWSYRIVNIKSLGDIPEGETVPVLYSKNGKTGHFVLADNKGIVWNSLDNSINVKEGKPISYREVRHD